MPLTPEQLAARKIGGSDAPVLMKGDHFGTTPYTLWEVKTGRAEPENLDRKLLVQMGVWTEPHNRDWYMAETGFLVEEVSTIPNPDLPWATANLDGIVTIDGQRGVWEAKHTSAWNKADPVQSYYAQLQHYMAVTSLGFAHLSIFQGNSTWFYVEVPRDDEYIAELMEREAAFWGCVQMDMPPTEYAPVEAPDINPEKIVDMAGNNEWAALADDWLTNQGASKVFAASVKGLKELVEADAAKAHGHGIQAIRNKRGITIKGE